MVLKYPPVANSHQSQPSGGQDHGSLELVSVDRIEEPSNILGGAVTPADFIEGPTDPPHHASDEGLSDHIDPNFVADSGNFHREDLADRVVGGVHLLAQTSKVMRSHEVLRRELHRAQVQRSPGSIHVSIPKRIVVLAKNSIPIPAILSAEPAVKARRYLPRLMHGHVGREHLIECERPAFGRQSDLAVEVTHLTPGVRSAIGATSSYDLDIFARDLANGSFQCTLHGPKSLLRGPAAKLAAVIADVEPNPFSRQAPKQRSGRHLLGASRFG